MRKSRKQNQYLRKILLILLVFMLLLIYPYAQITMRAAEQHIRDSVNQSNELVLAQIEHDYDYFKTEMSALCLSTYLREDVQTALFNTELPTTDIYLTMRDLQATILQSRPSISSVYIYNGIQQRWYAADSSHVDISSNLSHLLSEDGEPRKLEPVLRKLQNKADPDAYHYVFSYFMYEYGTPGEGSSFLVINQNARWFVDALTEISAGSRNTKAFLVSKEGEIFNCNAGNLSNSDSVTIQECIEMLQNGEITQDAGYYLTEETRSTPRYLVTYKSISEGDSMLIMLQSYEEVFSSVQNLRNSFLLIIILVTAVGGVLIGMIGKILYGPIEELSSYVVNINGAPDREMGELQQIRNALESFSTKNRLLQEQHYASRTAMHKLMLSKIVHHFDKESWNDCRRIFPGSPLFLNMQRSLRVIIMQIHYYSPNLYGFLEQDEDVLLFATENILTELLDGAYTVDTIKENENELVFILCGIDEATDDQKIRQALITLCTEAKKQLDIVLTVSLSSEKQGPDKLPELYREAREYMGYRLLFPRQSVLDYAACSANMSNGASGCSSAAKKNLVQAIRIRKIEQITAALEQVYQEISGLALEQVIPSVMEIIVYTNNSLREVTDIRMTNMGDTTFLSRTIAEESLEDMFKALLSYILGVLEITDTADTDKSTDKGQRFAEQVVAYIEENYTDYNLSLQSIADHMGLSSRYVSKKFKQCMDISPSDYILTYRMKQAAVLLIHQDIPINQVARQVGLANENYFYHLFRKQFGCTPGEFKSRKSADVD